MKIDVRAIGLGSLCVIVALAGACRQTLSLPITMRGIPDPEPGQMDLRREYWDKGPNPQHLQSEIEGLVHRGGAFEKHGRERAFYRSGQIELERHWVHGEPAGIWRTWWEDGVHKSECEFTTDGSASSMSFWHANGQLEASGPAINGRRFGHWDFYFASGERESSGDLFDGKRDGPWTVWNECSELVEQSLYDHGALIERWTSDQRSTPDHP